MRYTCTFRHQRLFFNTHRFIEIEISISSLKLMEDQMNEAEIINPMQPTKLDCLFLNRPRLVGLMYSCKLAATIFHKITESRFFVLFFI